MHDTAYDAGRRFFAVYTAGRPALQVVDLGAQAVNGSLREVAPKDCRYIGVDFAQGPGVDVVIDDPYRLPFDDASVDVVVSSSVFEHAEFFWLVFNEVQRVLRADGLFYLSVPSNGDFHRFPVDCWRFYPDSGVALQNWARRSGYATALLESFTARQRREVWNDFVAVFVKDAAMAGRYPRRILDDYPAHTNGLRLGAAGFSRPAVEPEDQELHLGRQLWRKTRKAGHAVYRQLPRRWREVLFDQFHARWGRSRW